MSYLVNCSPRIAPWSGLAPARELEKTAVQTLVRDGLLTQQDPRR